MYFIEKVVNYLRSGFKPYFLIAAAFAFFELGCTHSLTNALNLRLAIEWLIAHPEYFAALSGYLLDLVLRVMLTFLLATLSLMFFWIFATHRQDLEFTASSIAVLCTSFALGGFAIALGALIAMPVWLLMLPALVLGLLETWRMRQLAQNYN